MVKKNTRILTTFFMMVFCYAMLWQRAVAAPVSAQAVRAMINSVPYIIGLNKRSDTIHILALYDSAIPSSREEADSFVKEMDRSPLTKKHGFTAEIWDVADISTQKASMFYVPGAFSPHYQSIRKTMEAGHVFTWGLDRECVAAKICALSFSVDNSVEIYLSEDVLKFSGFDVNAAFRFIVRPI